MVRKMNENISTNHRIIPLSDYQLSFLKHEIILVSAISYEERGFVSLQRIAEKFQIKKALFIQLNVKEYLTPEVLESWNEEKNKVLSFLKEKKISHRFLNARDDDFKDVFKKIEEEISYEDHVVVDITTLPKNYILKMCQEMEDYNVIYVYTRGERYSELSEEEKSVGISRIVPIDGFEGKIAINKETILVLILGFEANRSLPFLEEFPQSRILALIGAPGIGIRNKTHEDEMFLKQARESNKILLNNSFVRSEEVNSTNPFIFSRQLKDIVNSYTTEKDGNIVIVPIGTKAQALGTYLYWKSNPKAQVLYPVPNRRPKIAIKMVETLVYILGEVQ